MIAERRTRQRRHNLPGRLGSRLIRRSTSRFAAFAEVRLGYMLGSVAVVRSADTWIVVGLGSLNRYDHGLDFGHFGVLTRGEVARGAGVIWSIRRDLTRGIIR